MLKLNSLYFDYSDKQILNNISLSVSNGEALHITGNNGVGKTTLLKLIAGIITFDDGNIELDGISLQKKPHQYLQNICYIGHKNGISNNLTVGENCKFDIHFGRREINLEDIFKSFDLFHYKDTKCGELSEGQRRRVGLMRIFMTNAKVMLLDEPFVALDFKAIDYLSQTLVSHVKAGGIVIFTSHQQYHLPGINCQEYNL